jgi:hypothetical protein
MAKRDDDIWFFREYVFNGFGKGWSKWTRWNEPVEYTKQIINSYDGSITQMEEGYQDTIEFGFRKLSIVTTSKVRLPKGEETFGRDELVIVNNPGDEQRLRYYAFKSASLTGSKHYTFANGKSSLTSGYNPDNPDPTLLELYSECKRA